MPADFQIDDSPPPSNGSSAEDSPDYTEIFGAPDYAVLIKKSLTPRARDYEKRVRSVLKAGLEGALTNGNYPDAAAILKHGVGFARATGELADTSAKTREILDMLTTPSSPYAMFVMSALPFAAQLLRNHEPDLSEIKSTWRKRRADAKRRKQTGEPKPRPASNLTFRLLGKSFSFGIRFKPRLSWLWKPLKGIQTQHPAALSRKVFSDPDVISALEKAGYLIKAQHENMPES